MIYLKLILAFLLSVLPFFYVSYIRPKEKTSPVWRNMFTALGTQIPHLKAAKRVVENFFHRLYDGMKRSDNFRKFFLLIILLQMIAVQFVDYSASMDATTMIQDVSHDSHQTAQIIAIYGLFITPPYASILAACISLTFFFYADGDIFLTILHNKQRCFFGMALLTIIILFASPRYLIITEMLEMMLMTALVYPNKMLKQDPKGRKPIPMEEGQQKLKEAA